MTRDTAERARAIGGHVLDSWQRERVVRESMAHLSQIHAEARKATLEYVAMWLEANHRDDDDEQWEACCNLPEKIRALAQALQPEEREGKS